MKYGNSVNLKRAKVDELLVERDTLRAENERLQDDFHDLEYERDQLRSIAEKMASALEQIKAGGIEQFSNHVGTFFKELKADEMMELADKALAEYRESKAQSQT